LPYAPPLSREYDGEYARTVNIEGKYEW